MKTLKSILRGFQDLREERFSRQRGIIRFGSSGLIGLEPVIYKGPSVTLASGAVIPSGAHIADVHLNSRKTAEYLQDSPVRARMRLVRDSMTSLRAAASWLRDDPAGEKVVALHGITLLFHQMERLGFDVKPLPAWPWVFEGIHMSYLAYLYGDDRGKSREKPREGLLKPFTPHEAWFARDDFLNAYCRPAITVSTEQPPYFD